MFLWSNPYKSEVMITSLVEMLELPNFGRMIISTLQFESCDKILLVTSWVEIMTSYYSFQKPLRRPRVAGFADIIKIAITLIKATLKDSKS